VLHIRRCLTDLISSGCEVHLIDNGSTDGTREIAESYLGKGLLAIDDLPWEGSFSLTNQLDLKRTIADDSGHDWILHCDADEWLVSPSEGQSLVDGLTDADEAGFNCVNFHEIVFMPLPGESFEHEDYAKQMTTYYFFQPSYPRLNRAWRRDSGLDNSQSGGHHLSGGRMKRFQRDFFLRHYIVLSQEHARRKYVGRCFSNVDRVKGWHGNRVTITEENLTFKHAPPLRRLSDPSSCEFDFSQPVRQHFWEWP
jgi:glycosyltransferase involved in cell wall biosynthesis